MDVSRIARMIIFLALVGLIVVYAQKFIGGFAAKSGVA